MTNKKTGVDQQLIRDLAGILDETNLTEIEVEQDDMRIRVSRQSSGVPATAYVPQPAPQQPAAAAPASQAAAPAAPANADRLKKAVPSPMVGTAYGAPAPGAKPFIEVGQTVTEASVR